MLQSLGLSLFQVEGCCFIYFRVLQLQEKFIINTITAFLKVIITNTVVVFTLKTTTLLSILTKYFYFYSPRQLLDSSSSINSATHWKVQLEHSQSVLFIVCSQSEDG